MLRRTIRADKNVANGRTRFLQENTCSTSQWLSLGYVHSWLPGAHGGSLDVRLPCIHRGRRRSRGNIKPYIYMRALRITGLRCRPPLPLSISLPTFCNTSIMVPEFHAYPSSVLKIRTIYPQNTYKATRIHTPAQHLHLCYLAHPRKL